MQTKTISRSLAGGEIAPEMSGRLDLNKYQTGVARALNFEIRPHGPAANRAGLAFVNRLKYDDRDFNIVAFIYNTEQAYELEFGDQYVRFHTNAGTVLNTAQSITSMTNASPGVFTRAAHGYTNGTWVYVLVVGPTGINGRFFIIANATANTFTLTDLFGVALNTTASGAFVSGTTASVYEIASPYVDEDLGALNITQSNDVMTLTHPSYAPRELRRSGGTSWAFNIIATSPVQAAPAGVTVVNTGGGTKRYRYKASAIASTDQEESTGSTPATSATTNITGVTQASPGVVTSVAHGRSAGDYVYVSGVLGMTQLTGEYIVNTVPTVDTVTLKTLAGVAVDTTAFGAYTSGGTLGFTEVLGDLATAGNNNVITVPSTAGAERYNFFKYSNGLWGYIGQAAPDATGASASFKDENVTADIAQGPPVANDPFTGADNYPRAVGYFQGRRWFGGSNAKPLNLYATKSGTESNMGYSTPTRDGDSITVRLTARQANTIRHIVPLRDVLVLTSGVEWSVNAGNGTTITPSNIDYVPQGYIGASATPPVVTSDAVIYAQDRGGRVREMLYSWEKSGYKSNDISIMAPHLFDGYTIVSMAYVRAPHPTVWCVRSDGVLLGLTYVPEQQVAAWHQHNTDGLIKRVCAVPEGTEDVLYLGVERTVNGATVKYLERKHTRHITALVDSFFVDSGVSYSGAATTTITGLWHLEGETVAVLADGAVHPRQTVVNGAITLAVAAAKVHVGLPYTADLVTLPMSFEAQAFGQGRVKNLDKAHIRVAETSGISAGQYGGRLFEAKQRTSEVFGSPPVWRTGMLEIEVEEGWTDDAQVHIQQSNPLPATILSLVLEASVGGS